MAGDVLWARFIAEEQYYTLETDEFDIFDEYLFEDGILTIKRITSEEEVTTSYPATLEIFWEIIYLNFGKAEYNFNELNFHNIQLEHKESHSFKAQILSEKSSDFLGCEFEADNLISINVLMELDTELKLKSFCLIYESEENNNVRKTIITII